MAGVARDDCGRTAAVLRRTSQRGDGVEVRVVWADGGESERLALTPDAAGLLGDVLAHAAEGEAEAVSAGDGDVSPEEAAAILDMALPLVRHRMKVGGLPFHGAGADQRLRLSDVLAFEAREAPVRAALAELAADTEDLERHRL